MGIPDFMKEKAKSSRLGQKFTEMQEKREQAALDARIADARQAEASAEEEVAQALVQNMNTHDSHRESENQVKIAMVALREAQDRHIKILREKDPVAAGDLEWRVKTSSRRTEESQGHRFNMVRRSERRVTVYPDATREDGSRPDRDKGEVDIRSAGVGPNQNYSISTPSKGRGRVGDIPHDAGITTNMVTRSRSDHFWVKVQLAWDNCYKCTGQYPKKLFIDFFEGLRGDQQEAMETLMIQSIIQNFPDRCVSRQKISRGQDGPVRCNFAMYGVNTLFAGSEMNRNGAYRHVFTPNDTFEKESAEWFEDTFRPI